MKNKRIGLVTYSKAPGLTDSDACLVKPFKHNNVDVIAVPWDKATDWKRFDALIVRSAWNYYQHLDQFGEWINQRTTEHIPIWNPPSVILWNTKKTYVFELQKKGIPIIPTVLIPQSSTVTIEEMFDFFGQSELVIKPIAGASAAGVMSISRQTLRTQQRAMQTLVNHSDCLMQPLMQEIYEGELSLMFIGRSFSHAVRKIPKKNEFRSNVAYGGTGTLIDLSPAVIRHAQTILNTISSPLLYARVDGLLVNGLFMLMELELIEPHLFLDLYPPAADAFAEAATALI